MCWFDCVEVVVGDEVGKTVADIDEISFIGGTVFKTGLKMKGELVLDS